jgi:hypothetical protein
VTHVSRERVLQLVARRGPLPDTSPNRDTILGCLLRALATARIAAASAAAGWAIEPFSDAHFPKDEK